MKNKDHSYNFGFEQWEFAGWGRSRRISNLGHNDIEIHELGVSQSEAHKLGQWRATAICGNDITSSCLYVSALTILAAGKMAPFVLLIVAAILFLFRKIYAEVGSALPLNGGTYTVLLNTTNKKVAAGAACLTLLSYIATAVISSSEAMHYAHHLWEPLNVTVATIGVLGLFAFLNILGISESAGVALGIFIVHMITLSLLVIFGGYYVISDPSILVANWHAPLPTGENALQALYYGFAAAMLGISGFESSANFIEEQKEGVFPKTLKNMWIAVAFFNPVICVLALGLVSQEDIATHSTSLLAVMGDRSAGNFLKTLVSIDAVLVLSGAVLTSYVGVVGLTRRMSLDRCLPKVFLKENKWRGTNHWIVLTFFFLCCGILLMTHDKVAVLAGVYTISFLCVMALFALGNLLLKIKRSRLPRTERARTTSVLIALAAVLVGLTGNLTEENLQIFWLYFWAMILTVGLTLYRVKIYKTLLVILNEFFNFVTGMGKKTHHFLLGRIENVNAQTVVYFTKGDNPVNLNTAALYVMDNEQTNNLLVVHVYKNESEIPSGLAEDLKTIDHLYPRLRIDFLTVKGEFGPELIERLSRRLKIPKNYMFIGTPGDRFPHKLSSLGGVRLILG